MAALPPVSDFNAHFSALSEILGCPACRGELRLEVARVVCSRCGNEYPIVDGIPALIADRPQER